MDPRERSDSNGSLAIRRCDLMLFSAQISLIFIVIVVSLLNLTMSWGNNELWTAILTGSLGYVLPNPKLKMEKIGDVRGSENV